jgi:hypothetical protein
MRIVLVLGVLAFCVMPLAGFSASQKQTDPMEATLELIQEWVGGTYDNSAQVASDVTNNVSEDKRFTPLHHIIVPVQLDAFEGLTYFSQLSNDGTTDTLLGAGIYQFRADEESGKIVMRYYVFNNGAMYTGAHLDLSKLDGLTPDDVHYNDGCQFYLTSSEDGTQISGVQPEDSCYPISRATGKKIRHVDVFIVRPGELWNDAKYYDLDGNLLFGNKADDYQKQVRIDQ